VPALPPVPLDPPVPVLASVAPAPPLPLVPDEFPAPPLPPALPPTPAAPPTGEPVPALPEKPLAPTVPDMPPLPPDACEPLAPPRPLDGRPEGPLSSALAQATATATRLTASDERAEKRRLSAISRAFNARRRRIDHRREIEKARDCIKKGSGATQCASGNFQSRSLRSSQRGRLPAAAKRKIRKRVLELARLPVAMPDRAEAPGARAEPAGPGASAVAREQVPKAGWEQLEAQALAVERERSGAPTARRGTAVWAAAAPAARAVPVPRAVPVAAAGPSEPAVQAAERPSIPRGPIARSGRRRRET